MAHGIYLGTAMNGRRGMVVHALSAVDMALWDLCGKALGKPVHALLGGATRDTSSPMPRCSRPGSSFEEYRDALCASAENAPSLGFKAVKTEITMNGPYAHGGMRESYDRHTEVLAAVRKTHRPRHHADGRCAVSVGGRGDLPVDGQGLGRVRHLLPRNADLVRQSPTRSRSSPRRAPMPIAFGEWLATRFEFEELMDIGKVQVAQPDVGRVGGIGEAKIVCDMAKERGLIIVPHCWKTGISISATAHLAFVTDHCAFIEYLPPQLCHERLRRELAHEELVLRRTARSPCPQSRALASRSIGTLSSATRSPRERPGGTRMAASALRRQSSVAEEQTRADIGAPQGHAESLASTRPSSSAGF